MTKKDYIILGNAIKKAQFEARLEASKNYKDPSKYTLAHNVIDTAFLTLADTLAHSLALNNPRFDADRFTKYIFS